MNMQEDRCKHITSSREQEIKSETRTSAKVWK